MTVDIIKLKAVAAATTANQCETTGLNDYSLVVGPATLQDLITGIERHRQVSAEGCKPESIISTAPPDAPALRDKVKPVEMTRLREGRQQHSAVDLQASGGVAS